MEKNNCYIDATLQILYEDKKFKKYVETKTNAGNSGNMLLENQTERNKKYISLCQIFKNMDWQNGSTVPYNDNREEFEYALEHKGNQEDPDLVIGKLISESDQVIYVFNYLDGSGSYKEQKKNWHCNDTNQSVLINFCRAAGEGNNYKNKTIEKLNYKIELSEVFKERPLKGLILHQGSTGNSGHYVAYKADDKGQWWLLDDCGCKNEISYNSTKELISDLNIQSNVFCAYYQAVKN